MRDDIDDRDRASDAETSGSTGVPRLVSLDEVKSDFKVSDNDPDIRGWDVQTSDNRRVGKVDDLIVDTVAMKVRYMTVKLDSDVIGADDDRRVLVPIGEARLDDSEDDVWVNLDAARITSLPAYDESMFNRDYEDSVRSRFTTTTDADVSRGTAGTAGTAGAAGMTGAESSDYYSGQSYDEGRFFGNRRKGREDERYITLAEEQLSVGKREVNAGDARVRKTVETERVSKSVPVEREEVTIERRPISPDTATGRDVDINEEEIRVPLKAEELVVDKRVVPTEEVVIKKRVVREDQTVEADLKKERVDIDEDRDVRP